MSDDEELDRPLPPLTEQALQWLVRLHDGSASERDWQAYAEWAALGAGHQAARDDAERLWRALGQPLRKRAGRRLPTALAVLLALGLAGGWQAQQHGWLADQRTGSGERRELLLADGSRLELAPRTRLDIALDHGQRTLHLYSGEIHVQVAADAARPFVVEAASGRIRALGTAFDVQRDGARVTVLVTEHAVRVSRDNAGGLEQADVQAGQRLDYDAHGLSAATPADIDSATAWRHDQLVFDGQPLGQVLERLARYHDGLILVPERRLRQLPVTGLFDTRDPQAQLELLQASLPIRIRQWPWLTLVEAAD